MLVDEDWLVIADLCEEADLLRAAFDAHFAEPFRTTRSHQIWNYWHVPDAYTYLRTDAANVVPAEVVTRFLRRLNRWAIQTLGVRTSAAPWLSLYVNGCGQTLHNDALNGQLGYVYSITRWDERRFLGGETLLLRSEPYWGTERIRSPGAGATFLERVPPRYNQLLVFDDRVIHGVEPIQGTMDPREGRVVLHGHLVADRWFVVGALAEEGVRAALGPSLERMNALASEHASLVHGFQTFRLCIEPGGDVATVERLCDRLLPLSQNAMPLESLRAQISEIWRGVRFPPAASPTWVTLPFLVGHPPTEERAS